MYMLEQEELDSGSYLPRINNCVFTRFTPPSELKENPEFSDDQDSNKSFIIQMGIMNHLGN